MKALTKTLVAVVVFAVASLAVVESAGAQATPESFFGEYAGTGISSSPDAMFFAYTDRDLDVEIGPDGDGFFVKWTTVIRDFTDPEPRRRDSRVVFDPADRPGFFIERGSGHPVNDGILRWANVSGNTLKVHVLALPADGSYGLQSYTRTLTGDRMNLEFISVADGQQQRMVAGGLARK